MTSYSTTTETPDSAKRAAFAALARQHEVSLLRAAKRMCGQDHDLAHDIVQDTLVSAYRAYLDDRFDGRQPTAWLMRILTNAFLFSKRQTRTESGLESDMLPNSKLDEKNWNSKIPSPDHCLLEETLSEPLERALHSLPESQRLCVILADIEELPYSEIAETLGVPIGTVRSRLARARMQMLTVLRDLQKHEVLI